MAQGKIFMQRLGAYLDPEDRISTPTKNRNDWISNSTTTYLPSKKMDYLEGKSLPAIEEKNTLAREKLEMSCSTVFTQEISENRPRGDGTLSTISGIVPNLGSMISLEIFSTSKLEQSRNENLSLNSFDEGAESDTKKYGIIHDLSEEEQSLLEQEARLIELRNKQSETLQILVSQIADFILEKEIELSQLEAVTTRPLEEQIAKWKQNYDIETSKLVALKEKGERITQQQQELDREYERLVDLCREIYNEKDVLTNQHRELGAEIAILPDNTSLDRKPKQSLFKRFTRRSSRNQLFAPNLEALEFENERLKETIEYKLLELENFKANLNEPRFQLDYCEE